MAVRVWARLQGKEEAAVYEEKKKKKNDQGKELCVCDRGRLIQLKLKW